MRLSTRTAMLAQVLGNCAKADFKGFRQHRGMPPLADSDDESDYAPPNGDHSNHRVVMRSLEGCDFVAVCIVLCPTMFGVPQTRKRVYYLGMRITTWQEILMDLNGDAMYITRAECIDILQDTLNAMLGMLRFFMGKLAMKSISDYLVPDDHPLYIKMHGEAEAKLEARRGSRFKQDVAWIQQHRGIFEDKGHTFNENVIDLNTYGSDNPFYLLLPSRDRSSLRFWDCEKPSSGSAEFIDTQQSQLNQFLFAFAVEI
jgi:hypothetical protein